jgi:hypothetical protein
VSHSCAFSRFFFHCKCISKHSVLQLYVRFRLSLCVVCCILQEWFSCVCTVQHCTTTISKYHSRACIHCCTVYIQITSHDTTTQHNRVMVHCPYDARPGQKIRFQLPIQLSKNELKTYSIHYNKEGWVRCVGTDLRFHWARHDGGPGTVATASNGPSAPPLADNASNSSGSVVAASSGGGGLHRKSSDGSYIQGHRVEHLGSTFNVEGSAFVRKLSLLEGSKPPAHTLELVRAEEASLDAAVFDANITFQHLSKVSGQPFQAKLQWFKSQCDVLRVPWDVEHQV